MITHCYADMLAGLGVERSHARPRISNDNPFRAAQFKTLKYAPNDPGRFTDIAHAHEWTRAFNYRDNHHRPHDGLAILTPAKLLQGRVDDVVRARQIALDAHDTRRPERYVNGPPIAPRRPTVVHINPDHAAPATERLATAAGP